VDASVVLAWLLRDPVPEAFRQILDDHISGHDPAVAPELLWYEVANVLARGADLPRTAATEGFARFQALELEAYSLGAAEYQAALELALKHRLTVYMRAIWRWPGRWASGSSPPTGSWRAGCPSWGWWRWSPE
jgi:predicted nucleic acid-binding protein